MTHHAPPTLATDRPAERAPAHAPRLAAAAALLAALAAGCGGPAARPALPRAYEPIAAALTDTLHADPVDRRREPPTFEAGARRFRDGAAALRAADCPDPEIRAVAREAGDAFAALADRLDAFRATLDEPPYALLLGESFLRGLAWDLDGVARLMRDYDARGRARRDAFLAFLQAAARAERARLALPPIAARYAGPVAAGPPALGLDLDGAWGFVGPGDRLALVNRSGRDLHRCTVRVELRGRGEPAVAVHYVPTWPAGASRHALYEPAPPGLDPPVGRRTPTGVERAIASIWCDELAQEGIALEYDTRRRDEDVARYCRDVRVLAEYRPRSRGLLRDSQRRVALRLEAPGRLERPRVTIAFRRRDGAARAWTWPLEGWGPGETRVLDTGGDLPWDPDEFDVEVGFPDTGYAHRTSWTVR